jgi:hypothetical protein
MAKKIIRTGTTADPIGDSLKNAFIKVNDNFTELYNALGLSDNAIPNIGAFEFTGSVMTTTDSSAIVIDQATTITSNLSVGGNILPQTANGGDLGSSTLPWRGLYVSTNTIYIGGVALSVNGAGNLLVNGSLITGGTTSYNDLSDKPNLGTYATQNDINTVLNEIDTRVTTISYNDLLDKPNLADTFSFNVAADDSTQRVISNNELIKFTGAGGITTSSDAEGNITINYVQGDIRSEGDINIDINLADSTLRRWRFGEDGDLTLPSTSGFIDRLYTDNSGSRTKLEKKIESSPTTGTIAKIELDLDNGNIRLAIGNYTGGNDQWIDTSTWAFRGDTGSLTLPPAGKIINNNNEWTFGADGSLTIPGDIKSNSNINIDINLSDSTLRRWQFGEDGNLTLPEGLQTSSSGTLNLFTDYSSGNINIGGVSPTINMGGGQVNVGYLNTRIVFGYSGVLTAGTSFTGLTGTPASNGVWTTAIATGTNGNGGPQNGVPVSFTVRGAFGTYSSVQQNYYGQGQNYAVGNTITIAGTQLGGTSPANDLTFTIAGEVGNTYPNLGPGSLVFDYGLGRFFGYIQNTAGTSPVWSRLDNAPASSLVNGAYTASLGTDGSLTFPDATVQTTAYPGVDGTTTVINGSGKISLNAGLSGSVTFKGGWNANTNTPTLANGAGTAGFMYIVTTNGVTNLGAGLTSFSSGDLVIYDGTNWINVAANNGVVSFNSRTGAVTLTSGDVTAALGYTPYNATNPNSYISSITSGNVTTALGYTPYNATNPNSYIAASSLSVSTNTASGAGSLSYSAGVFTFTPAVTYTLPTATSSALGGIKIDNNTIVINDGVISVGGALTSATIFKGSWDASANTPTLSNSLPAGVAAGWQYIVSVQGTRDIGAGSTVYTVGDLVIYNGTSWSRIPGGNTVTAFNSRQGAITLTSSDVTTALGFTPISLASVSGYQFSVAADDSTQRLISSDEVVKFIGAGGITTASDAEGAITITGPDLSTYATQSYVTSRGYLTTVDYSIVTNKPVIPDQFTFNVAGDDSTMRTIGSEETIKFIGSGGITTTTDVEGNVNIILGSLNSVNLVGTTLAASVVNSSLTSVGTLTRLNVSRDVTARGFNTDQITVVGNRISTTVTNANLELECNGTGGVVINTVADATTASTAASVGYLGLPQSTTATSATLAIGDAGKHIYVTTASQTITIPANGTVAYPIGTTITFIAGPSATTVSIAITTDTMRLAGGALTGTRTLAANGMATAVKVAATTWYINGVGLT